MMIKHLILLVIIIASLIPSHVSRGESADKLTLWILASYSSAVTRTMLTPFTKKMEAAANISIHIKASVNYALLYKDCELGKPEIVIVSLPVSKEIQQRCDYSVIASAEQDLYLIGVPQLKYYKQESSIKIGLLRGIEASKVAKDELPLIYQNIEFIEYVNFFSLVADFEKDSIEGYVLPIGVHNNLNITSQLVVIFKMVGRGQVDILSSPALNPEIKSRLQKALKGDDDGHQKDWMKGTGLGPIIEPIIDSS